MENTEKFIFLDDYLKEKEVRYIQKDKLVENNKRYLILPNTNMYIDNYTGRIKEIKKTIDKSEYLNIYKELIKCPNIRDYYEKYGELGQNNNLIKNLEKEPWILKKLVGLILEDDCLFYFTYDSDLGEDYFIHVKEKGFIPIIKKLKEFYIKDFSSIVEVLELW